MDNSRRSIPEEEPTPDKHRNAVTRAVSPASFNVPFIFQIPNGFDVISCVTQLAQCYQRPVTVLSGNGLIADVGFTFPQVPSEPRVIYGIYHMLSFAGTYNCVNVLPGDTVSCFTVSLIDVDNGILAGGIVASTMRAVSPVMLVVFFTHDLS
ncbi:AT-hook motif nuclear-localized protein 23-like [Apium graveolens]|uniref:AT-hook motif nuclear-localized protein 23-like n=1 Tax=Apium graveolens TaxID=4045 RepID=UPI003D7974EC